MVLCCSLFVVEQNGAKSSDDHSSKSSMGLTLSYALTITSLLSMTVRLASVAENSFNAVERVGEYADLEAEAPLRLEENPPESGNFDVDPAWPRVCTKPGPSWPEHGHVVFKNVSMRYRADTPLVLTNFTADIASFEKIGVVGRTGAGKSTLFNSLFRTAECENGSQILIDDVDVATIGLFDLRSKLSILPQEPVLFQVFICLCACTQLTQHTNYTECIHDTDM